MIVGIDVHKHTHTAALLNRASGEIATLTFANSPEGFGRLRHWLADRGASDALVGIENASGYGRPLVAALVAAGSEVLTVPSWRTHRDRDLVGPGKSDAGDATAIAEVVLRKRSELGPAAERDLVRAMALLEALRVSRSRSAPRRSSACERSGLRSILRPSDRSSMFTASAHCGGCAASSLGRVVPSRPPLGAFASSPAKSAPSTSASPNSRSRRPNCSPSTATPWPIWTAPARRWPPRWWRTQGTFGASQPSSLRALLRCRPNTVRLGADRWSSSPPSRWQSSAQRCVAPDRDRSGSDLTPGADLPRPQARRREDAAGGAQSAQAPPRQRRLQAPACLGVRGTRVGSDLT
jgi:hypothetical protein